MCWTLNPLDPEYSGMCFSCKKYDDYGPIAGRFNKYNGRCSHDEHEQDALVKCNNGQYEKLENEDIEWAPGYGPKHQ